MAHLSVNFQFPIRSLHGRRRISSNLRYRDAAIAPAADGKADDLGHGAKADVVLTPGGAGSLLFRLVYEDERWIVERLDPATPLIVDTVPTSRCAALEHLSVIQMGDRTFVFLTQAEEALSSGQPVDAWLVRRLSTVRFPPSARSTLAQTLVLPGMRRVLLGPEGPGLGAAVPLRDKRLLIGRDAGRADICLADPRVSRLHAWIERRGSEAVVADMKSTNGTFVNGQAIVGHSNAKAVDPNWTLQPCLPLRRNLPVVARQERATGCLESGPARTGPSGSRAHEDHSGRHFAGRSAAGICLHPGSQRFRKDNAALGVSARVPADEGTCCSTATVSTATLTPSSKTLPSCRSGTSSTTPCP